MSEITIITNNRIRYSKYYPYDMNKEEQKKVVSSYGGLIDLEDAEFVFYKGHPYYMGDCMRLMRDWAKDWHGYFDDTFFSTILVKHVTDDNNEQGYIFGMAYT